MVHIKKKRKEKKRNLEEKKKKINSDVGEETKARDVGIQEEAHYGGGIQKSKTSHVGKRILGSWGWGAQRDARSRWGDGKVVLPKNNPPGIISCQTVIRVLSCAALPSFSH